MNTGKVQTVRGDVPPEALGKTLTHEHLCMQFSHFYQPPPKGLEGHFDGGITLERLGYVRQYPYSLRYNLLLNDDDAREAVLKDVLLYKALGGGTIVENSTEGLGRDAAFCRRVSEASGVHVVAGTGHYVAAVQHARTAALGTEQLYAHMRRELTAGCDDCPAVRAGFMGEIASEWPLREMERRAIVAAGELQAELGCGVSFHPHRHAAAPFEILRLYAEAGGRLSKAVMSHLDRTLLEPEQLLEFAALGSYCQLDLFGVEVSHYQLADTAMPSDAQRLLMLRHLLEDGRQQRVLVSHDIHTKHRLTAFGGHGYGHILSNVLPRMLRQGFSQQQLDDISVHNPARWLAVNA